MNSAVEVLLEDVDILIEDHLKQNHSEVDCVPVRVEVSMSDCAVISSDVYFVQCSLLFFTSTPLRKMRTVSIASEVFSDGKGLLRLSRAFEVKIDFTVQTVARERGCSKTQIGVHRQATLF